MSFVYFVEFKRLIAYLWLNYFKELNEHQVALEISKSKLCFTKYEECYMVHTIKMYDASTIEETFDLINTKDMKDLL